MPTVEEAHHSVRLLGTSCDGATLRQSRSLSSAMPQRAGSSSMTVRRTAPANAYMAGTMCERTQAASTTAVQPRYLPSRTAQANNPRNSTAMARLKENEYSPASVENRLPP